MTTLIAELVRNPMTNEEFTKEFAECSARCFRVDRLLELIENDAIWTEDPAYVADDFLARNPDNDGAGWEYRIDNIKEIGRFLLVLADALKQETRPFRKLPYNEYLKTDHWKNIRQQAFTHYGAACCLCNSKRQLNVHHRSYDNLGEEPMSDLIVLCRNCHAKFHDKLPRESK